MSQSRPAPLKSALIKGLIIKSVGFPAPVENTDPLEGQGADCCVMAYSSLPGLHIHSASGIKLITPARSQTSQPNVEDRSAIVNVRVYDYTRASHIVAEAQKIAGGIFR